jgi:hypothetical protein
MVALLAHHNLALCYQKDNALANCTESLKNALRIYRGFLSKSDSLTTKFRHLKYLSKTHMQFCAILSQQNKHIEALEQAKCGAMYSNEIIYLTAKVAKQLSMEKSLSTMSKLPNNSFVNKQFSNSDFIQLLGRKIIPIIDELASILVPRSNTKKCKESNSRTKEDARNLFGHLKSNDWVSGLNIGNIMQLSPLTIQDLTGNCQIDIEITRETLLEKIALLAASYFCISTEKRFLAITKVAKPRESEFWHAKALQIACCFLPSDCPLVTHIFTNYQKHHSPLLQPIVTPNITISLKIVKYRTTCK